jgi:uncharacterized metal-binding protein YceD (DUF177 family)
LGAYRINIVGLSNKIHHFNFDLGAEFFRKYDSDLVSTGNFRVDVVLDKHETFIEAEFKIQGKVELTCDRSLEPFDFPIETTRKMLFKYGEKDEEITDEIMTISRETVSIELGQFIYEFITLAIPLKKLHPRFQDEVDEEDSEGKIVYSSSDKPTETKNGEEIDPRWNMLKKLK